MKSRITIDTASNFKPCIRVVEPQSHYLIDSDSEDVRDKLVKGFRELLNHTSNTVEVIREGEGNYMLYPVEDELSYMTCLVHKWMHYSEARVKLRELAKKIIEDTTEVSEEPNLVKLNPQDLDKLREEGMLTYTDKV